MNKTRKAILLTGLLITLTIGSIFAAPVKASVRNDVTIKIDGVACYFSDELTGTPLTPLSINDRTYLPLRSLAEALNREVGFSNKTITISGGLTTTAALKTGTPNSKKSITEATVITRPDYRIFLGTEERRFTDKINGNTLSVYPFIYKDRTYLPLRAVGEALNKEVSWLNELKIVYIGTVPKEDIAKDKALTDARKAAELVKDIPGALTKAEVMKDVNKLMDTVFAEKDFTYQLIMGGIEDGIYTEEELQTNLTQLRENPYSSPYLREVLPQYSLDSDLGFLETSITVWLHSNGDKGEIVAVTQ